MDLAILGLCALVVLSAGVGFFWQKHEERRDREWRRAEAVRQREARQNRPRVPAGLETLEARRLILNLKSGRAIDGYLVRTSGDLLFLRNSTAFEPGAAPVAIDGEAVVARFEIDFLQAP